MKHPELSTGERLFCVLFLLLSLLLPLTRVEAYPFSLYPMFNYQVKEAALYQVRTPGGQHLDPEKFGLGTTTCGYEAPNAIHYRRGRHRTDDVNVVGRPIADRQRMEATVRRALESAGYPCVDIEQVVFGELPSGKVGVIHQEAFRVYR